MPRQAKSYWSGMCCSTERDKAAILSWFSPLCDDMMPEDCEVLCDEVTDATKKMRATMIAKDGRKLIASRTFGKRFSIKLTPARLPRRMLMSDLADDALKVAAQATGLRPDQVERAVAKYRDAAQALHTEPDWRCLMHSSGKGGALAQYIDPTGSTAVCLQIESHLERGNWVQEPNIYTLGRKAFESFGEARAAELRASTKPKPHVIRPVSSPPERGNG